jgi:hypothetical protein
MYMQPAGFSRLVFSAASNSAWPVVLHRLEAFATAAAAQP